TIQANPYFISQGSQLRTAEVANKVGASIGLFVYQPVREKLSMRFAVEAHLANTHVLYDTGKSFLEKSYIYPVCIELPIALVFGRHYRYDLIAPDFNKFGFIAAIRPVIPLGLFHNSQPLLSSFNVNLDAGITRGIPMKKGIMRADLIFSYGLFNLIGEGTENFKTNSIEYLGRNFVGLRAYFN
ncbi:MAG: hypothetical protein ACKVOR_10435, partial [Flavobacteriales bacterium]